MTDGNENRPSYTPSSYGFVLYILTYPLAISHFVYYFASDGRIEAKLLPSTLFLCLLLALPMIVAGVNMFLAADNYQIDSLEDGWSVKHANIDRDIFNVSVIRDLDVNEVNHFVHRRSAK